jgi:D-alanine transaminase
MMTRTVYLNGAFLPETEAHLSIFDRGFLFGDGIYEVTAVLSGKLVDSPEHMARLARSAGEIGIRLPVGLEEVVAIEHRLVADNRVGEGLVYLELTRGAEDRNFLWSEDLKPTLLLFTQEKSIVASPAAERGYAVMTLPDQRWARRDIKSVCLLPQVLAKRAAKLAGFDEAWFEEDGLITEGASWTALIVTADGRIVTRGNSHTTLPGCTRLAALALAREAGLTIEERPFSRAEALGASEVWLTSASNFVMPVVRVDETPIGDGRPGPLARRFRSLYIDNARATAV